jgi:hypothetical protein
MKLFGSNMIGKFLNLFKKVPDNSGLEEDFRIEAVHFAGNFYKIRVTGNGGESWKFLQTSTDTIFPSTIKPKNSSEWGNFPLYEDETFNASEKSISWYRNEIKNYDDFEKYNAAQFDKHLRRCKVRDEQIHRYFNRIKENTI